MLKNLELLGLTTNEITVYKTLLQEGAATATQLRKTTTIANSRVYAALDELIHIGLVTYEKYPKGRRYTAVNPEILKQITKKHQEKIESLIPALKQLQKKQKQPTETAVFEGFHGFKRALLKFATECPKNETVHIIGFSNQAYKNEKLAALLRDVNKISKQKKHKFKMILDNKENKFYQSRKQEGFTKVKFMNRGFASPAAIDIFRDYVYILLWDETPYAFVIKNQNIADGFRSYFEFLWGIAKK